jgi:hypothetical protein
MTRKNGLFYIRIGNEIGQKAFDTVFLVKGNHPGETMYFVGHKINEGNNKYAISVHRSGLRFRAYWTKTEALKYFNDDVKKYSYAQLRAADSLEKYQTINAYAPGVTQAWTVAKNPKRKRRVLKNPEPAGKKAADKKANPYKYRIRTKDGLLIGTGIGGKSWFTLEEAKRIVDRKKGQNIIEIDPVSGRVLWEVF